MPATLSQILGPDGPVALRLGSQYETRPQQIEMAQAVADAFEHSHHLLVEAGTGVGKSFAYLLPAVQFATRNRKRVVISTHTISLQQQLIDKDIPLIQAIWPDEFTVALAKGRSNYLCKRRLEQATRRQSVMFPMLREQESLEMIQQWAATTTDGSRSDLPRQPDAGVWESVCAERGNCLGKKCEYYKECIWQAARRRMHSAQVLIVNHALLFSDLALRMAGVNYLPQYDLLVLDEAHNIEEVAAEHFGLAVSENAIRYYLRRLYDSKRGAGFLSTFGAAANPAIESVLELDGEVEEFSKRCFQWHREFGRDNGRLRESNVVENTVSPRLRDLAVRLNGMLPQIEADGELSEIANMANKSILLADTADAVLGQTMPDAVYWMEFAGRNQRRLNMRAAPVNVAEGLKQHLFKPISSVVMCSATLCTSGSDASGQENDAAFAHISSRLGVERCRTLALGSPFDYPNQVTLYVESDLPEPSDVERFTPAACERILHYLKQTNGGAFVLFTSYRMMTDAAGRLADELQTLKLPLLVQGDVVSPGALLEQFRSTPNAVLFGVSSFWQGVDVRGPACGM